MRVDGGRGETSDTRSVDEDPDRSQEHLKCCSPLFFKTHTLSRAKEIQLNLTVECLSTDSRPWHVGILLSRALVTSRAFVTCFFLLC